MADNGEGAGLSSSAPPSATTTTTTKRKPPIAVVAPELMDDNVPMRNAWVGTLRDKRDISKVIKIMSSIVPGMSHLKRCSGNRLIVAFADSEGNERFDDRCYRSVDDLRHQLAANGVDLSIFHDDFEIVTVPARSPRTKAQARSASKSWPINFHPDPTTELILGGRWFDDEKIDAIEGCMRACIDAASRQSRGNDECNGSAVAFDPLRNKIIAIAASRMDLHPMWHASMLVVDLVAGIGGPSNNGGAYEFDLSDDDVAEETTTDAAEISRRGRKRKFSGARKRERVVAYPTDLADILGRYDGPSSSPDEKPVGSDYLCTDYWIFLLREPCPLCAMALLHSRASDIFYGVPNERRGVLGTRAVLHATPGLNHRYNVWRGICEEECGKTFDQISTRSCSPSFVPHPVS